MLDVAAPRVFVPASHDDDDFDDWTDDDEELSVRYAFGVVLSNSLLHVFASLDTE